ncbi:MAG: TRAP transporter substrate-binding protein [Acidobacteriota bacterium]|nr:TRAP transporter substrate-binding protein [Acidobacteriota bacterium]
MKRRDFLKKATAASVGGAALNACGGGGSEAGESAAVHTSPRIRWRLASSFPRGLDTMFGAAEMISERVEALSAGRFTIRPYPDGEIVPGLQVLDAVQQGTVQVGHTASYYFTGKNPALAFDTAMPFGFNARGQIAWLYERGGLELMREVYSDFNIICFPGGNTGTQMGGWFNREVNDAEDLKGLKMRIPGLGGEVMSRMGVTVQVLAGGDIYPALERGAIDATEWVGPYDDEKLGFFKVAKYYYYPGWWEPGPNLSMLVNQEAWAELPVSYQEMFASAAKETNLSLLARYDALNPPALARLLDQGVELRPFSEDILSACEATATELMEEEAAKDATYARILTSWRQARTDSSNWFATSEKAYADHAFRL